MLQIYMLAYQPQLKVNIISMFGIMEIKLLEILEKNIKVSGNNAQAPTFTDFDYKDTDPLAQYLTGKNGVNNPERKQHLNMEQH